MTEAAKATLSSHKLWNSAASAFPREQVQHLSFITSPNAHSDQASGVTELSELGPIQPKGMLTYQVVTSGQHAGRINAAMTTFTATNGETVTVTARRPSDCCWLFRQVERVLNWGEKVSTWLECTSKGFNEKDKKALCKRRDSLISEAETRKGDGRPPEEVYAELNCPNLPEQTKKELILNLKVSNERLRKCSMYDDTSYQKHLDTYIKHLKVINNSPEKIELLKTLNVSINENIKYSLESRFCPICQNPLQSKSSVMVEYNDSSSSQKKRAVISSEGAVKLIAGKARIGVINKNSDAPTIDCQTVKFLPLPETSEKLEQHLRASAVEFEEHLTIQSEWTHKKVEITKDCDIRAEGIHKSLAETNSVISKAKVIDIPEVTAELETLKRSVGELEQKLSELKKNTSQLVNKLHSESVTIDAFDNDKGERYRWKDKVLVDADKIKAELQEWAMTAANEEKDKILQELHDLQTEADELLKQAYKNKYTETYQEVLSSLSKNKSEFSELMKEAEDAFSSIPQQKINDARKQSMVRVNKIKERAETIEVSTEKRRFAAVQSNELKSCLATLEKEKKQLADDYDELKKVTSYLQQERAKMQHELYSQLRQEVSDLAKETVQTSKKVKATFKAISEDNLKDLHNDAHEQVTELSNKAKEINREVCDLNCNFLVPDQVKEYLEKLEEHKNLLDKNLKTIEQEHEKIHKSMMTEDLKTQLKAVNGFSVGLEKITTTVSESRARVLHSKPRLNAIPRAQIESLVEADKRLPALMKDTKETVDRISKAIRHLSADDNIYNMQEYEQELQLYQSQIKDIQSRWAEVKKIVETAEKEEYLGPFTYEYEVVTE